MAASHTALAVDAGRGPVLVRVTYPVRPDATDAFVRAMDAVRRQRRRNGAMTWGLYADARRPDELVETFSLATWAEHEREQDRRTAADASAHDAARAHLIDGGSPLVDHYVAVGARSARHRHTGRHGG